ncbi:DMT family transporter [Pseudactinotalea sp. HY158]|uniref:EamA family transporter n=1 Tax=Pseudactinotalea sp. HY158 TaxID=2654547 RepID=UPI001E55F384|nr:EamA family transporter [Pseudactinotalea sp. HY158]
MPAPALFITAGLSQYAGAAVAVGLFAAMPPHTVAWLRALAGAVVLLALVRPWRAPWNRATLTETGLFGLALVGMNMLFYVAIGHLPLGVVVALEFAGPVVVAARGHRSARGRAAVALAAAGVVAISVIGLDWGGASGPAGGGPPARDLVLGLVATAGASACWAAYMVLAGRIAAARDGQSSLAVGTTIAALAYAPLALPWAGPAADPALLPAILGMALLSTVVPYMLDQVSIRRLGTAAFALLNALLPATATVVGLVALRQRPGLWDLLGLAAITVAVALTGRGAQPAAAPPEPA